MRENPQLPDSPPDCLPYWTALSGGANDLLSCRIYSEGHLVVAELAGELDLAARPGLARRLDPLAEAGRHLILDLGALEFCDCTGLGLFLQWQQRATAAGGALHLAAARPQLRRLLALTGTRGLLPTSVRPCRRDCCVRRHLECAPPTRGLASNPG
jgi:anti-anti-sigma factor